MSKLDRMLTSPHRLMYLLNILWGIFFILALIAGHVIGIIINGLLLFVCNYPWLKLKWRWYKLMYFKKS